MKCLINFVVSRFMKLILDHQKFGFCHAPVCAQRKDKSDRSELVNQLTFGETFEVLSHHLHWIELRTLNDGYQGYVDRRHLCGISDKEIFRWHDERNQFAQFSIRITSDFGLQTIPGGSFIGKAINFKIGPYNFEIVDTLPSENFDPKTLLNIPYLWGGKSTFGFDCSGLTQFYFRQKGINLSRDASDQQMQGIEVQLDELKMNDLLFFQQKGKSINHVGIYWENNKILHCSGRVRLDSLQEGNIYNEELNEITHTFHSAKRMI